MATPQALSRAFTWGCSSWNKGPSVKLNLQRKEVVSATAGISTLLIGMLKPPNCAEPFSLHLAPRSCQPGCLSYLSELTSSSRLSLPHTCLATQAWKLSQKCRAHHSFQSQDSIWGSEGFFCSSLLATALSPSQAARTASLTPARTPSFHEMKDKERVTLVY